MLDIICLWIGRCILFLCSLIIVSIILFFAVKGISILLRKPYYCIKRLLPWKWITEKTYFDIVKACNKNTNFSGARVTLKGRFGNFYIPNKANWWDAKNHFFFIKKG